jgi:hypothetical protein
MRLKMTDLNKLSKANLVKYAKILEIENRVLFAKIMKDANKTENVEIEDDKEDENSPIAPECHCHD